MGATIAEKPTPAAVASTAGPLIQTVPRESTSLATVTPKGNVPASQQAWNEFIEKTIALSAEQHQGRAALFRACKSDSKACVMQVEYSLNDGTKALATVVQNGNGNITRREVCVINTAEVIRDCTNWDTGAKYHDVRIQRGIGFKRSNEHFPSSPGLLRALTGTIGETDPRAVDIHPNASIGDWRRRPPCAVGSAPLPAVRACRSWDMDRRGWRRRKVPQATN